MCEYKITRSIIHQCYALSVPPSVGMKLAGVDEIIPLYSLSYELAEKLRDAINGGDISKDYWIDRLKNYKESFIPQLTREINGLSSKENTK
ncbi:hypothetical protein [Yersinia kristensenii]|uniref:hypothetical protein n=1 Tax=Yersinia TaxID=629 RepID=UPI00119E2CB3|nr:hypothetical protein [Yersinia kristensenii]